MAQSAGLHEPEDQLSAEVIDRHRALTSIQEELEAVDWYDQRVAPPTIPNWPPSWPTIGTRKKSTPRWSSSGFAARIPCWIGTCEPICSPPSRSPEMEAEAESGGDADAASGSLGIGSLKGAAQ